MGVANLSSNGWGPCPYFRARIFLDETPASLITKGGDHEKAAGLLQKIPDTNDVQEVNDLVRVSEISKSVKHPFKTLRQRKYRTHSVMSIAIPCFQQMGGINALPFLRIY